MTYRFNWSRHRVIIFVVLVAILVVLWAFAGDFKGHL